MVLHCCAALYWGLELVLLDDESLSRYREQPPHVTKEIELTLLHTLVATIGIKGLTRLASDSRKSHISSALGTGTCCVPEARSMPNHTAGMRHSFASPAHGHLEWKVASSRRASAIR